MDAVAMSWPVVIMMLIGGGAGDGLDLIDAKAYWSDKAVPMTVEAVSEQLSPPRADPAALTRQLGSADASVRDAAAAKLRAIGSPALAELEKSAMAASQADVGRYQALIDEIESPNKAAEVRKLMAIRTLGELKDPKAVALLRPLLKSKAPFEAEYAAAAIAAIEGKPFKRPMSPAEKAMGDIWLMPETCGVVGQLTLENCKAVDVQGLLGDVQGFSPDVTSEEIVAKSQKQLVQLVEKTGNFRLERASVGLADQIDNNGGFFMLIMRGRYDRKAMAEMIVQADRCDTYRVEGVEVIKPDNEVSLILPNDEQFVFFASNPERPEMIAAMIKAVKARGKTLDPEGDLGKMVAKADTTGPVWAVARMSDTYRQAPVLSVLNAVTLTSTKTDEGVDLKLRGNGSDAAQLPAAAGMLQGFLEMGKSQLSPMIASKPVYQPLGDCLNSIKAEATGDTLAVDASIKGSPLMIPGLLMKIQWDMMVQRMRQRLPQGF